MASPASRLGTEREGETGTKREGGKSERERKGGERERERERESECVSVGREDRRATRWTPVRQAHHEEESRFGGMCPIVLVERGKPLLWTFWASISRHMFVQVSHGGTALLAADASRSRFMETLMSHRSELCVRMLWRVGRPVERCSPKAAGAYRSI